VSNSIAGKIIVINGASRGIRDAAAVGAGRNR